MTRLNQFLDVDDAARDRAAMLSSVAGIVAFALAKLLLDIGGKALGWVTFSTVGFAYLIRVWWYCSTSQRERVQTDRFLVPRRLAMGAVTATVLVLFIITPSGVVEAAILDRRLRTLARGKNLSPQQAKEVGSLLDDAAATGRPIELTEATRVQVYRVVKTSALENPNSRPFVDAAESIVRYTRAQGPSLNALGPQADAAVSAEALAAYTRGVADALSVLTGPMVLPTRNPDDAKKAIDEFTSTIELAKAPGDRKLLSDALTARATMYLYLVQPNDVLRDAEAAEANGSTDLSNILDLEGNALLWRGTPSDLERSICIFTLLASLPPPNWAALEAPRKAVLFHVDALGNLGLAYYRLGKFEDAIRETESALDLIYKSAPQIEPSDELHALRQSYMQIIASNLRLGRINQAALVAKDWAEKTGEPYARVLSSGLNSGQVDLRRWLKEYEMSAPNQAHK